MIYCRGPIFKAPNYFRLISQYHWAFSHDWHHLHIVVVHRVTCFSSEGERRKEKSRSVAMMAESESGTNKANPKTTTSNNNKKKRSEFEFCKVCKLNHDQGLRHKYFANHKKSLSVFLSRFRNKISEIRSFLKNPTLVSPQHASRNRFWCVFCDVDVIELESSFACANGIRHLASAEHLKNLKQFFWKQGVPADQLDAFIVSDVDIAKWEKRCATLENEAVPSREGCHKAVAGPSSDIHNQPNNGNIDFFKNVYSHSLKSYPSNNVLPLQLYTNEYQISGLQGVSNAGLLDKDNSSSVPLQTSCSGADPIGLHNCEVDRKSHSIPSSGRQWSSDGYSSHKGVGNNGRMVGGESNHQGLQMLTQISSMSNENARGNVHSGAPPPWFEVTEGVQINSTPVLGDLASHSNKSGKSKKLNPKRVGAAWAEKRKIELEKEKRGETVRNEFDINWLPNFGRVWQSGSRKESKKEFEKEKQNVVNVETHSEMPVKIQPYVSKRMRMESSGDHSTG